jgi:diguanylate cyclase (GGDEF)-like protein
MVNQRRFSNSFVIFFPLILFVVVLLVTAKNYFDAVNRNIDTEYARIDRALSRGIKVLAALDYSFSHFINDANPLSVGHSYLIKDELCYIWPIQMKSVDSNDTGISSADLQYMLVGNQSLCEKGSTINKLAERKAGFAPSLSFLHDIEPHIVGIHYIDRHGYVMSSPDTYAKNFTKELLSTLKARPFWQKTAQDKVNITLAGPGPIIDSMNGQVITLAVPFYEKGIHQGMLSIDFNLDVLLTTSDHLAGKLHLVSNIESLPAKAVRLKPIELERLSANHSLYYDYNLWSETKNLVISQKYSIVVALFIYLLSTIVLFYVNMHTERRYFKDLAAKDPMTGLLNRRGMESVWRNKMTNQNVALAIFDVDNFKTINDNYGHDVGDSAIQLVAKCMRENIRSTDVASRFGGEEFVLAIYGDDMETIKRILERVKQAIVEDSTHVTARGFTVSAGVVFRSGSRHQSFNELFKSADEKLYQAKSTGKNKICY